MHAITRPALICASLALAAATCHAQIVGLTGNTVVDSAKRYSDWTAGYLFGVASSSTLTGVCPPAGYTSNQIDAILTKWFAAHPEKLHLPANVLVAMALRDAWPCTR